MSLVAKILLSASHKPLKVYVRASSSTQVASRFYLNKPLNSSTQWGPTAQNRSLNRHLKYWLVHPLRPSQPTALKHQKKIVQGSPPGSSKKPGWPPTHRLKKNW